MSEVHLSMMSGVEGVGWGLLCEVLASGLRVQGFGFVIVRLRFQVSGIMFQSCETEKRRLLLGPTLSHCHTCRYS